MSHQKLLFIRQCGTCKKLKYFFTDCLRFTKAKRFLKYHKTYCAFVNQRSPSSHNLYLVKLTVGRWTLVNAKLKKGLNIAAGGTKNDVLKIIYMGGQSVKDQIVWT